MTKRDFLDRIQNKVRHLDKNAEIILFGSRARNDNSNDSDWDFLILLDIPANESTKEKIRNELFEIELESDQVISSIIHSKSTWTDLSITPLYEIIQKEGVTL
jgi:uncharacterized protein